MFNFELVWFKYSLKSHFQDVFGLFIKPKPHIQQQMNLYNTETQHKNAHKTTHQTNNAQNTNADIQLHS